MHFGILMMTIVTLGSMTPPVGVCMYTVCSLLKCPVEEYIVESIPFVARGPGPRRGACAFARPGAFPPQSSDVNPREGELSALDKSLSLIDDDRLFPAEPSARAVARRLYAGVKDLPIISPHGHTDPRWYAEDAPFPDPATLFVVPDHYIFRMLYSQGIDLAALGIPPASGERGASTRARSGASSRRTIYLFRGTPSRMWLDHVFATLFGFKERLSGDVADFYFDRISAALETPEFRPRALYERFNIEAIATTDSPLDQLADHADDHRSPTGRAACFRPTGRTRSSIRTFPISPRTS